MDEAITFTESAFKHGVDKAAIYHAFTTAVYDHVVRDNPEKYLLIGFDANANPLEILYNVIGPNKIRVFHAMPCRKPWRDSADI